MGLFCRKSLAKHLDTPELFEVTRQGLDFYGDDRVTPFIFVLSPILAVVAALLAWRNVYPIAAALIVSALTSVGILIVIAFGIIIAIHGF